jgi:hypothetical protein
MVLPNVHAPCCSARVSVSATLDAMGRTLSDRLRQPVAAATCGAPLIPLMARVLRAFLPGSIAWILGIAILLSATTPVWAREVRVGVLIDGTSVRQDISADDLERAVTAVYGEGLTLTVAPQTRLSGYWNAPALNAALDRLEADPQVDVVVTTQTL